MVRAGIRRNARRTHVLRHSRRQWEFDRYAIDCRRLAEHPAESRRLVDLPRVQRSASATRLGIRNRRRCDWLALTDDERVAHQNILDGRNRFRASVPKMMKITSTTPCAIANGGSEPFGASACSGATFWKSCAISTNTLRYNAMTAVTTYVARHFPASLRRYSASNAIARTAREITPTTCDFIM